MNRTVVPRLPALLIVLVAGLAAPLAAWAANCATAAVSAADARAAVAFVARAVASAHAGSQQALAPAVRRGFAALEARPPATLPAWRLAAKLNEVLALAGDGHLAVRLKEPAAASCARLPVELAWTADGLFVRGGSGLPAGARILGIGRRDLDALHAFARRAVPHENDFWAHAEFARLAAREDMLRSLGAVDRGGQVHVDYLGADGQPAEATVALGAPAAAAVAPIATQAFFPEQSTAVLRIARLELEPTLVAALKDFFAGVDKQSIRKVAIDLRGNPGGDSSVAVAVLQALGTAEFQTFSVDVRVSPELLAQQPAFDPKAVSPVFQSLGLPAIPAGARHYLIPAPLVRGQLGQRLAGIELKPVGPRELFLLVDGGTFSSASLFALLVRDNRLGTLVGEPIGNATDFNGSEIHLDIPATPYYLNLSTARLLRPDPAAGPAPTLVPDVLAPLSPAAAAAGIDPALEYVRRR